MFGIVLAMIFYITRRHKRRGGYHALDGRHSAEGNNVINGVPTASCAASASSAEL